MTRARALLFAACAALFFGPTPARAAESAVTPSDGYRISVLTMGPGDAFVSHFGHDALLVERAGLPALVYNFGTYTEQAIAREHVLGGTLFYFLSVDHFAHTLAVYRAQNRSVVQQVLALEPPTAERLARALSVNSLPAHTTYHYDFALDNCTTRVRDALDRALDGALRRELRGKPTPYTYRAHALRFTADDPALAFLFDLGLGRPADRPLDAWDDAFLPERLSASLRRVRVTDANGTHPLVASETTLFAAARAVTPERPPLRGPYYALVGLGAGALLAALGGRHSGRVAFGLLSAVAGAVVGAFGLAVLLLLGTHVHAASHENLNALVCPAFALLLAPLGVRAAFRRAMRPNALVVVAACALGLAVLGTLVALACGQRSLRVAALVVPLLTGTWLGARRACRSSA